MLSHSNASLYVFFFFFAFWLRCLSLEWRWEKVKRKNIPTKQIHSNLPCSNFRRKPQSRLWINILAWINFISRTHFFAFFSFILVRGERKRTFFSVRLLLAACSYYYRTLVYPVYIHAYFLFRCFFSRHFYVLCKGKLLIYMPCHLVTMQVIKSLKLS